MPDYIPGGSGRTARRVDSGGFPDYIVGILMIACAHIAVMPFLDRILSINTGGII